MLDPAIIHDLHRAMVPPTIMPPAIERVLLSPRAEASDRTLKQFMDRAEADSVEWRANLKLRADALDSSRDHIGDDALAELDRTVDQTERQARLMRRSADRLLKRRGRLRKKVEAVDPSAARVLWAQTVRMHHLELENAEAVRRLAVSLGNHRDRIDTRGPETFQPNAETIAAMQEARAGIGMRRTASIADLMAELDAEDD